METLTIYIANDNTKFLDEDICKQYEEEKAKNPNDHGIRFYNATGEELCIEDIAYANFYRITNPIIAKAMYNSIKLMYIKPIDHLPVEIGCYFLNGNVCSEIDEDILNDIIAKYNECNDI